MHVYIPLARHGIDNQVITHLERDSLHFRSSGIAGVIGEVEMDIKRLAKRNFGRDDRYNRVYQV